MKKISLTLLISFILAAVAAQSFKTIVFKSGSEGYKNYRIPAIISLPNGNLLAFCEGRLHGSDDFGDINIVMKRSVDKGRTWQPLRVVVDYDTLQAGNPAPAVDMTDPRYPGGRIFLFYNTGNKHEGEIRKGIGLREVWFKTSVDGGMTWSESVNITTEVHRPLQPGVNPLYNFKQDWRSYANTPGHAMQFSSGKYKGRIYVAANHSAGNPQPHFMDYRANGYYTDDHGKTFKLSDDVNIPGGNENMAVELSGNKLMLNLRNQKGDIRERIVAVSVDGGQHFDMAYFDKNLPDPVCQGSILAVGSRNGKSILAFCNNADSLRRDHLALRISFDEGKTWEKKYIVDEGQPGAKRDFTGYSDIVQLGKNQIGVLYERDFYAEIAFTMISWE